jgi:hypothetical protein
MNELVIEKQGDIHNILVCHECDLCHVLVATDEKVCHHCGKPLMWSRLKWRLYTMFGFSTKEYADIYMENTAIRDKKLRIRMRDRDRSITCQQLSCSLESLEELSNLRRLEVS